MKNDRKNKIVCPSPTCIHCPSRCHRQQDHPPSRDEALEVLFAEVEFTLEMEFVALKESLGRVTAEETYAAFPVPVADGAQHDGIMVNWEQVKTLLNKGYQVLEKREFCLCAMGNVLISPFDTVIPSEQVRYLPDGRAEILALPGKGQGIVKKGNSIRAGERLLPENCRLVPAHLSILRLAGVERVPVWKKPQVAVIPVGMDTVPPGCRPGAGQTVEADSILIESIIKECGGEAWTEPVAEDSEALISQAISSVISHCDCLVLIGGLGRNGARYGDYTGEAVARLGRVLVHGMEFGPGGKPMLLGEIGGKCVVGIPAPPHAALTQAEQYLPAVMGRFLHCPCYERQEIEVNLPIDGQRPLRPSYHPHVGLKWTEAGYEMVPIRMGDTVDCFVNATGIVTAWEEESQPERAGKARVQLLYGEETIRRLSCRLATEVSMRKQ